MAAFTLFGSFFHLHFQASNSTNIIMEASMIETQIQNGKFRMLIQPSENAHRREEELEELVTCHFKSQGLAK